MEMPTLRRLWTSRRTVDAFGGLNRSPRTGEGEFAQMENLSSDFYPVLAPCPPREQLDITGVTSLGAGQRLFYTRAQSWCWETGELTWGSARTETRFL